VAVGSDDDAVEQTRRALGGATGGSSGAGGPSGSTGGSSAAGGPSGSTGGSSAAGGSGGSGGADLVVEFAGTAAAARQAIQLARRGGRVVLAGATGPGRELSGVDLSTIVRGHLDIYGSLANPRGIPRRGLALIARRAVDVRP